MCSFKQLLQCGLGAYLCVACQPTEARHPEQSLPIAPSSSIVASAQPSTDLQALFPGAMYCNNGNLAPHKEHSQLDDTVSTVAWSLHKKQGEESSLTDFLCSQWEQFSPCFKLTPEDKFGEVTFQVTRSKDDVLDVRRISVSSVPHDVTSCLIRSMSALHPKTYESSIYHLELKYIPIPPNPYPKVTGNLPSEMMHKHLRKRLGRVRACYNKVIQQDPNLNIQIKVHVDVKPNGKSSVRLESINSIPEEFKQCLLAAYQSVLYPPSDEATAIQFSLNFAPPAAEPKTSP